ncbi:hypothetical protein SANTM175S_02505 [Streptomyces antimycoticus]
MHLIDGERQLMDAPALPARQPCLIPPAVVRGMDDGGGGGRALGAPRHRVGAQGAAAVGPGDLELVERALADTGQEQLPHAAAAE